MKSHIKLSVAFFCLIAFLCLPAQAATIKEEAVQFVGIYSSIYQKVQTVASEAVWDASTDVTPEHDGGRVAANKAQAAVTGNPLVISEAKRFLARKAELDPMLVKQIKTILLDAAENPGDIPDIVNKRIEAEGKQASTMDSYQFCLEKSTDGVSCAKPVTANEIDELLLSTRDVSMRLKVWTASKEIGPALKPGLRELQGLRNAVAQHFGYPSYFDLATADFDMTADEMRGMLDGFLNDIQPLYKELHCWTKYELAKRYNQPVPDKLIPAHWIGNRWSQEWPGLVEGIDLDPLFKDKKPEWIVQQAEGFFTSLGLPKMPASFWTKSDLYQLPKDSKRKKNTHASAWHVDLDQDMRSLMNIEPDASWWTTAHHELGHIYYYVEYSTPSVPVLLRRGANRAFHEGIAELAGMASKQEPYLKEIGVLPKDAKLDQNRWLLNEALVETVTFLPWAAGTVSAFERDLYAKNLHPDDWNKRWWDYVAKYQGIAPPMPRGGESCDACTKTHINDYPCYYYNYAVATIIKYQLYTHICREILHQDPHACKLYGSKEAGDFLRGILQAGATKDWQELLKEKTGERLSTKPMLDYFQPLTEYLKKENAGRTCGY